MGMAFAVYAILHSPIRDALARLIVGRAPNLSYFAAPPRVSFVPLAEGGVFALTAFALLVVPAAMLGGAAALCGTTWLRPPAGPGVVAVPAVLVAAWGMAKGWRPARSDISRPWRLTVGVAAIGALGVSLVGLSTEFYEHVWGVDAAVASRPDVDALLYHTGYAPFSYAGDYPLLGPQLSRTLLVVDAGISTRDIVSLMQRADVRHAYVPVSASAQARVEALYDPRFFDLAHVSTSGSGETAGTTRYLFRLRHQGGALKSVGERAGSE